MFDSHIIFMTAHVDPEMRTLAIGDGAVGLLTKLLPMQSC